MAALNKRNTIIIDLSMKLLKIVTLKEFINNNNKIIGEDINNNNRNLNSSKLVATFAFLNKRINIIIWVALIAEEKLLMISMVIDVRIVIKLIIKHYQLILWQLKYKMLLEICMLIFQENWEIKLWMGCLLVNSKSSKKDHNLKTWKISSKKIAYIRYSNIFLIIIVPLNCAQSLNRFIQIKFRKWWWNKT